MYSPILPPASLKPAVSLPKHMLHAMGKLAEGLRAGSKSVAYFSPCRPPDLLWVTLRARMGLDGEAFSRKCTCQVLPPIFCLPCLLPLLRHTPFFTRCGPKEGHRSTVWGKGRNGGQGNSRKGDPEAMACSGSNPFFCQLPHPFLSLDLWKSKETHC